MLGLPEDTELINKSIPNFRKLVCIFGGLMPQTRRRRWRRSSSDSTWPPQEQMTGGSSSHAAAPQVPNCVTGMTTWMTSCPPNHDLHHMMFLLVYKNLDLEKREREREEVRQVMLQHLKHQLVLTGMTIWMTLCPPKHGLQHMMFLPLYMNVDPEKRERERQEVRHVMLHHLKHQLVLTGMTI